MSAVRQVPDLAGGRLVIHNTAWNLLGQVLPIAVGILVVPFLVRELNVDRFGLLSLVWIVIGYFGLFDLGLGRALTKLIADKLGANEEQVIPPLAWTSLLMMLLLGIVGGAIALTISPLLIHRVLKVPATLQAEALKSFMLLAVSIPIVTVTSGLRGIMEAQQRFRALNLIRIPLGIFFFAGPLLVLPFSHNLVPVVGVLILGRVLGCATHFFLCLRYLPALRHNFRLDRHIVLPLFKFGGWITLSNIVGPAVVYMDRFLIANLLSVSAVAYYTAPFDVVNRLVVIPVAISGVLFPSFAVSFAQNPTQTRLLLDRGLKYVFLLLFPIILSIVLFAPEGLSLWLGAAFSEKSYMILRWLAAGVFINSMAQIPFALIQSVGRPDITAILIIMELPLYLPVLWLLTNRLGTTGAAAAWAGRVALEAIILLFCAHRILPPRQHYLSKLGFVATGAFSLLYLAAVLQGYKTRVFFLMVILLLYGLGMWCWRIGPRQRMFQLALLRKRL